MNCTENLRYASEISIDSIAENASLEIVTSRARPHLPLIVR